MFIRIQNTVFRLIPCFLIITLVVWVVSPQGRALEERLGLEFLFSLRGPVAPPDKVAVIAITRSSARELGLSEKLHEWTRQPYADLVHSLVQLDARSIVFDVFFESPREAEGDKALEAAIRDAGNVILFARSERESMDGVEVERLHQPFAELQAAALYTAPLVLPKVPARVSRFFARHPAFDNTPTLHSRAWLLQQKDYEQAWEELKQRPRSLLLNFYGPPRTVRTLEFSDIVKRPQEVAGFITGATVFVGYSAQDQPDQRDGFYTAFTSNEGLDISGVELAATAYANLAEDNWIREPLPWQSAALVFIVGTALFLCARFLAPLPAAAVLVISAVSLTCVLYIAFAWHQLWLPWFSTVAVTLPCCGGLGIWLRNRELFAQKRRLQWAFGKYLPHDELERLVAEKGLPALRDYSNSVCLVTDAAGYSRLSESLSPVVLAELMQAYYQAIIPPIRKAGGIISDVAGDGVIALWLHLDQNQAWTELKSVVKEINTNIDRFNAAHPGRELPTRIGIHAGEMVLGHFGAMDHHEFRAMGDIINTTSRLEGANKQLGTRVLVSASCVNPDDESLRYLGRFCFVGKSNPLPLYTLKQAPDPVLLKQYQLALMKFEAGQTDNALKLLKSVHRYYPEDGPTDFAVHYLSERRGRDNDSSRRDGFFRLKEK